MNRRGFFRKAVGVAAAGAVAGKVAPAEAKPWDFPVESSTGVRSLTSHVVRLDQIDMPTISHDPGIWLDPRFVKQMEPMTVTLEWAPEVEYEMVLQPKKRDA